MTRRNPVFWTAEESEALARAAWAARPAAERTMKDGWARYVTKVQGQVLEPNRIKHIAGMHMIKPVMLRIGNYQAGVRTPTMHDEATPQPLRMPFNEPDTRTREQLIEMATREPEQPRGLDHTEIRMIANIVLDAIEERVRSYFIRHPPIASADNAPATAKPEIAPSEMLHVKGWADAARQSVEQRIADGTATREPERSLRIGVVGFDAREQEQIARGLNQKVKLTFAYPHHHSKSGKLIDKVAGCHAIFVRVKWTSHAHIAALKKQLSTKCHFLENQPNAIKCADVINEWLKYTQAR